MAFSRQFIDLFEQAQTMSLQKFQAHARDVIRNNPAILTDIEDEFGLNALTFVLAAMLTARKESHGIVDKKFLLEKNLQVLAEVLLEKGCNPNLPSTKGQPLTAADIFIKFIDQYLLIERPVAIAWCGHGPIIKGGLLQNDLQNKFLKLLELFVENGAKFDNAKTVWPNHQELLDQFLAAGKVPVAVNQEADPSLTSTVSRLSI